MNNKLIAKARNETECRLLMIKECVLAGVVNQDVIADQLGCTQATISRWLSGDIKCPAEMILAMEHLTLLRTTWDYGV